MAQRFDIQGTMRMIFRLQPQTRRVVVIGGPSKTDQLTLSRIEVVARSAEGIEFEFWTNRPFAELRGKLSGLPDGTAVFMSTVQRDVTGQPVYTSQLAQMLAPVAKAPMFVLGAGQVGSGALGGMVVDVEKLGARAGQLALQVMDGAKGLPVDERTNGTPMVDWRALQRWRISKSRLPAECVIRYQPHSLWEEHRTFILGTLTVVLAQGLTIAGLLAQRAHRRRAEAELQVQRAELAHVSRASTLGQLASSLAHELNQPLGAILRNAEAAEMFLANEKPDLAELREIVADIRKDDKRAGDVIDRMRAMLKRKSPESSQVDLRTVLQDTVALAQPDAAARGVRLTLETDPGTGAVQADRIHLQQVVLNLILNGMEAVRDCPPEERLVAIRAGPTAEGAMEVAVCDSGRGIPAENQGKIFEPFFTTKADGLGMGLAISRSIIEAHGGKIRAENTARKGAIFRFSLPGARGK